MNHHETATFAAGCFWGVEADFRDIPGVLSARVGYIGGHTDNPTYREVCNKGTGHAEAVEVVFDPAVVTYDALLDAFWKLHDPTTLNRQGPDVGTQYRSAIFYHGDAQRTAAETSKARHQSAFTRPIVTEIAPAPTFWAAEDYHQRYLEKQGART
ncbi:MAG: peptide-methionine (S)-S-oxide reductase MsrA [Candidatus Velthaea sp.]